MKLKVKLNTVNDAVLFAAKCNEYDDDVDYMYNDHYILDAKSMIGVISAGLGREATVLIHTENFETMDKFLTDMKLWLMEER